MNKSIECNGSYRKIESDMKDFKSAAVLGDTAFRRKR